MTKFVDFKVTQGNNSCITEAKCKMQQCVIESHTQYKFHTIPFIDYSVMAEYAYFKASHGQ